MATYIELITLKESTVADSVEWRARVKQATIIAAEKIQTDLTGESARVNFEHRQEWSRFVMANPQAFADQMVTLLLAQYRDIAIAQIKAATDAQLQAVVDTRVDSLI